MVNLDKAERFTFFFYYWKYRPVVSPCRLPNNGCDVDHFCAKIFLASTDGTDLQTVYTQHIGQIMNSISNQA